MDISLTDPPVIFTEIACAQVRGEAYYRIGVITLNAARSLNALNLDIVKAIQYQLDAWQLDPRIVCIWLESSSDRAFCAGGDIRALYKAGKHNIEAGARVGDTFFQQEYRLDYALHTYPKPVICWGEGIVMGGGMGLMQTADIRVVTPNSRLAMPEITIGLFTDVGAAAFLNRLGVVGRFIALTGVALSAADALHAGLADYCLPVVSRHKLRQGLACLTWGPNPVDNTHLIHEFLGLITQAETVSLPASDLAVREDTLLALCGEDSLVDVEAQMLAYQSDDAWLMAALDTFRQGSALAACLIDAHLHRCRERDLCSIFKADMVLAANIVRQPEFYEGVRALLIDKDQRPKWQYANCHEVPESVINAHFEPPWTTHPLAGLASLNGPDVG